MIYVLAYPQFEPRIASQIGTFRSEHEPERAKLVPPHITLVFGVRDADPSHIISLCEGAALTTSQIDVTFDRVEVVEDPFEKTCKLALICSKGGRDLNALHEQLYDGPHRAEFNADNPFRPHMTVATKADRQVIEATDPAPLGAFPIPAIIKGLDVVQLVGGTLTSLASVKLRTLD